MLSKNITYCTKRWRDLRRLILLSSFLNKKVLIEGHLLKNDRGRYELCGREFTSGSLIDVWREDPVIKDGGYYISSRIEHRGGDYYCVDMPYIKLDGLKARYMAAS
ncbi:DUF5348 domain-containing protein [Sporosarcina luteola]|uniref:DUF5348 domain-containing protein n=1 Tax=Sporosarcina luteola TaxID=582850 RepID=UPI003340116C